MRKIEWLLLFMLFAFLFFQENSLVLGLNQNEASIELNWSQKSYFQGEYGALTMTFQSQCPEELKINKIYLNFNWTTTQETKTIDLLEDPIGIPSNDNITLNPITFQVPQNATEGTQKLIIRFEGMQHGLLWYDFEWLSNSTQIEIKTDYQLLYTKKNSEVFTNLNEAKNADYQNQEAKDLLTDASTEYNLVLSLANQKQWQDAISHLEQTQDYLNQAKEKEQQISTEELVTTATVIIVLILVGLLVSIVLGRKSKNYS